MIDKEIILRKMKEIRERLEELAPLLQETTLEIVHKTLKLHSVERLFQLIVDTTLDINNHIITRSALNIPDDLQSTFLVLGKNAVITNEFAEKIAPSVGLRNQVVHRYGEVDIKRMVDEIRENIGDYYEYLKLMQAFLDRK